MTADVKALAKTIFEKFDINSSGGLSRDEVGKLVNEFTSSLKLNLSAEQHSKMIHQQFNSADTNKDGVLSHEEFDAFAETLSVLASSLGSAVGTGGGAALRTVDDTGTEAARRLSLHPAI